MVIFRIIIKYDMWHEYIMSVDLSCYSVVAAAVRGITCNEGQDWENNAAWGVAKWGDWDPPMIPYLRNVFTGMHEHIDGISWYNIATTSLKFHTALVEQGPRMQKWNGLVKIFNHYYT